MADNVTKFVSQAEFTRLLRISGQSVNRTIKSGLIDCVTNCRREYIVLNCYKTIQYIKSDNGQRKDIISAEKVNKKKGKKKVTCKNKQVKSIKNEDDADSKEKIDYNQLYR